VIFGSKKPEPSSKPDTGWKAPAEVEAPREWEVVSKAAPTPAVQAVPAKTDNRSVKNEATILTAETEFKGTLAFNGDLQLHGKLEGSIEADNGLLTIGESAMVKAEIHALDVVVYGKVQGNIIAQGRLELRGRAQVYGDVRAGKFLIEEGALFVGRSENLNGRAEEKPDFSQMFTKLSGDPAKIVSAKAAA
jgi:cytoskeletal protein CcmA (bactofilin family)